ncbi:hypothetical protein L7F22_046122 [Adiantum nelumboides]|nr:hypothetical protein [Adiantum nelumboides]
MGDYHFVYKDIEGTTTEWDDIQRRLGNLPTKPEPFKPPAWAPHPDENAQKNKDWINDKTEVELLELEDDIALDDDRFLEEYRKKRLAELRDFSSKPRFGSVLHIVGADFVREVSNAPPDVWVVVHLFKNGMQECELLGQCFDELAKKYAGTKFVKIISTDCIPKYPDRNLPTVLIYNHTNVKATLVGLHHFGGRRCTPEDVAFTLCQYGPVLVGSGDDAEGSKDAVADKVRREFLEKIILKQEQEDSDKSQDED